MNNRTLLLTTLAIPLCGLSSAEAKANKETKPNFVLFMADDCTYSDIACYGGVNISTPRIDGFAKEGMLFSNGYQAAPMSSPTRNNLFSGVWPVKTGAYPNHTKCKNGTQSIVHQLRPLGYKVALVGKKHIGSDMVFPFDLYAAPVSKGGDVDFEAINRFIDECNANGDPYCLLVTSNQPHTPWTKGDVAAIDKNKLVLPPIYVDCEQTRDNYAKYLAEVNYMDSEFGRLLDVLEDKQQSDNSVVVFLSEQGNSLPFAKWTCYDQGVHSAYIVRWPDKVKAGSQSKALVEYIDIVPTFVDIAGGELVAPVDGQSLKNVLLGKQKAHKKYTYSLQTSRGINNGPAFYGIRAVADDRYRYIINLTAEEMFENEQTVGQMFAQWKEIAKTDSDAAKLVHKFQFREPEELYDVKNDPYCLNNLVDDNSLVKKKEELSKALKAWMSECGDQGQQTEMDAYYHTSAKKKINKIDAKRLARMQN